MIDTGKVTDRRQLHYNSIDDLLADIDRVVAADKAGKLRRTGNWTAGQVFGHLATWMEYAYEGFPINPPWFVKLFLKFKRKSMLEKGMAPGVRIPGMENGTLGTEQMSTEEGASRLKKVLGRLRSEPAKYDSPAFGKMTESDRIKLNLRHAELHMSFLHP